MADKLTAADVLELLVSYRDVSDGTIRARINELRDEAARRETGETKPKIDPACNEVRREQGLAYPRTCQSCGLGPCKNRIPSFDAPPPPADELDDRERTALCNILRIQGAEKALRMKCRPEETSEYVAAAAIEALRAREKALEGALRIVRANSDRASGPGFFLQDSRLIHIENIRTIDQALAAGGGNGG